MTFLRFVAVIAATVAAIVTGAAVSLVWHTADVFRHYSRSR